MKNPGFLEDSLGLWMNTHFPPSTMAYVDLSADRGNVIDEAYKIDGLTKLHINELKSSSVDFGQ